MKSNCWTMAKPIIVFTVAVSLIAAYLPVRHGHWKHPNPVLRQNLDVSPDPPVQSDECLHPPPDSCSFYAECLESRYHCGTTGYPLGYGEKYCTKFQVNRATLSARGQVWMLDTMHCLQEALVPDAIAAPDASTTCMALEDKAFGTHAHCYVSSGVCRLPPSDWAAVLEIVDIKTLFDSWDAFKATLQAGTECLEFYEFLFERDL